MAAQKDGRGIGRIRLKAIPDASAASLQLFIVGAVEPDSLIHTDGWEGYRGLEQLGYRHRMSDRRFYGLPFCNRTGFRPYPLLPTYLS